MVVEHAKHPSFFVAKLWSYFIPTPPDAATAAKLEALYKGSGYEIRPVLEAILCAPQLYDGPAHGQAADRLRSPGCCAPASAAITDNSWSWVSSGAGQRVYYPPDVAGWDDKRWLDTNTTLGRWEAVSHALDGDTENPQLGHDVPGRDPRGRGGARRARSGATPT